MFLAHILVDKFSLNVRAFLKFWRNPEIQWLFENHDVNTTLYEVI